MSNLKLYEVNELLSCAIEQVSALAETNDGVIDESWSKFLDDLDLARQDKILNIARYIKSLDAEQEAVAAEARKLRDRARAIENKAEWLKRYLSSHMTIGEKVSDSTSVVSWRKSTTVEVIDQGTLPEAFIKTTIEPMKAEIKRYLADGHELAGARLVEHMNISIR